MAVLKSKSPKSKKPLKSVVADEEMVVAMPELKVEKNNNDEIFGEKLDPAEEKMLDRILMVIVVFILAWLGLSILLVFRGYACSEWIKGGFICAGIS